MHGLDALGGGYGRTRLYGLSGDGRYAVGWSDGDALTDIAVRWDLQPLLAGGEVDVLNLGSLTGMRGRSAAVAASQNGSVVVGFSEDADGLMRAFRWREGATNGVEANVQMLNLGTLGGAEAYAEGVSRDGNWVVGHSDVDEELQLGFRWSEETGMESIADWLERHGVTTGNVLNAANGISDDGRVVVGQMIDPTTGNIYGYLARSDSDNGGGLMNVDEYQRTLFDGAGSVANAGELLMWLPMNGAHHRPLMMTPSLSGDMCAWATGDFALHSGTSTGLGLAEMGACGDLAGGAVRLGGAVGTSRSWQDLALGGSSRMAGQYVLGEVDWQPDGTPLLLSLSGTIGSWQAQVDRAYSNGEDIGISRGETNAVGGVVRLRADWLNAAVLGNTSITPWTSIGLGTLHVNGFTEQGGPFPARFDAQNLAHVDVRLGVTAVTELSTQTSLSTTFEVAHRSGTGAKASGQVEGLFDFSMGGGQVSHTWVRAGAELDHKINDHLSLSGSVHLASSGRDPSLAASLGLKGSF
jgi:probable HAF family extracellular repeat protein